MEIKRFQVLAGTSEAHVEGQAIVGRFGTEPLVITDEGRLCTDFANCRDTPAAILAFTRRYAPLGPISPGKAFRFNCYEAAIADIADIFRPDCWIAYQRTFREKWEAIVNWPRRRLPPSFKFPNFVSLSESSLRQERNGMMTLQASNFLDLINLCFSGLPWPYLRICPRPAVAPHHGQVGHPACARPFFIADHLKQNYCWDKQCKNWGERQGKLKWWDANRKGSSASRSRTKKGGRDVAN